MCKDKSDVPKRRAIHLLAYYNLPKGKKRKKTVAMTKMSGLVLSLICQSNTKQIELKQGQFE